MKKLQLLIIAIVGFALFTYIYYDGDTSIWSALFMGALTTCIVCYPIPYRWGIKGYAALVVVLSITLTLYLVIAKDVPPARSLLYSVAGAVVIGILQYIMGRTIQRFKKEQVSTNEK